MTATAAASQQQATASSAGMSVSDLKSELVRVALEFRAAQEQSWEAEGVAAKGEFTLGREGSDVSVAQPDERFKSPLAAESLTNVDLAADGLLAQLRSEMISIIEKLAVLNPTPTPFVGWR